MQKVKTGIEIALEKANMTEKELAGRMKLDPSTLKGWEVGAGSMKIEALLKMAKVLNASTDLLLFAEDREPLSLEYLQEENRKIVIDFYKKLME